MSLDKAIKKAESKLDKVIKKAESKLKTRLSKSKLSKERALSLQFTFLDEIKKAGKRLVKGGADVTDIDTFLFSSINNAEREKFTTTGALTSGKATALVLSGGAAKGSFQVGALNYLHSRSAAFDLKVVLGTSIGAINATFISAEGWNGVRKLSDIWLQLRTGTDIYQPEIWLSTAFEIMGEVYSHFKEKMPWRYEHVAELAGNEIYNDLLRFQSRIGWWEVREEIPQKLKRLDAIQKSIFERQNLFHLTPLANLLSKHINFADLASNAKVPLRLATVNLNTWQTCYVTEDGTLLVGTAHEDLETEKWDLSEHTNIVYEGHEDFQFPSKIETWHPILGGIIASSAIPAIFRAIRLRGKCDSEEKEDYFTDGGVREMLPIEDADCFGADQTIAITTYGGRPLRTDEEYNEPPTIKDILFRSLDVMLDEIAENEAATINEQQLNKALIKPEKQIADSLVVDPGLIRINMAHGYMMAYETIKTSLDEFRDLEPFNLVVGHSLGMDIIMVRRRAYVIEDQIVRQIYTGLRGDFAEAGLPDPYSGTKAFFVGFGEVMDEVNELRELKRLICQWVDERVECFKDDKACVPNTLLRLTQEDEGRESVQRWWRGWEEHRFSGLDEFDIWDDLQLKKVPGTNVWMKESQLGIQMGDIPESNYFG